MLIIYNLLLSKKKGEAIESVGGNKIIITMRMLGTGDRNTKDTII
jgi:hypothetical protein